MSKVINDYTHLMNVLRSYSDNIPTLFLSDIPTRKDRWKVVKIQANSVLQKRPEMQAVVLSYALYPMLKWTLLGEDITEVISHAIGEDAEAFQETQIALSTFTDCRLKLPRRDKYFAACRNLTELVESAWSELKLLPLGGIQMAKVLGVLVDPVSTASRYEVVQYFMPAIEAVWIRHGDVFEEVFDALVSTSTYADVGTDIYDELVDEKRYLFHNTDILIKEYLRCSWLVREQTTGRIPQSDKLLTCKSPEEIMAVTEHNASICSASIVLQFLQLINGAVSLVRYYPAGGERHYKILRLLMNRQSGMTEAEIAALIGMSEFAFSRAKKEAYSLLGVLLWGLDSKTLISQFVPDFPA